MSAAGALHAAGRGLTLRAETIQRLSLWLLMASSCIAFIEPSPYEAFFVLALAVFVVTGLRVTREAMPLTVLLVLYNLGGAACLIPWLDEQPSVMFVAISFYLGITAIFFALVPLQDADGRLRAIESGAVVAALVATAAAVLGFFDIGGLGASLTRYDGSRATGMFKDPNVLGPYLVAPAAFLFYRLMTGTTRRPVLNLLALAFIAFGELLSFSRGAWGDFVAAVVIIVVLCFITARTAALRRRVVVLCLAGLAVMAALAAGALAFDKVRAMLIERASFNQAYDLGESGRFGLQKRSVPLLLEETNGFGPLKFRAVMGQDPHNVYVNAFASYGWLGGFAYFALIAATLWVGWRCVVQRTPLQVFAIPIWAALFPQIVQGFQIDTDHWRHFWMLLGLTWGIAAANERWLHNRRLASA
ncbi:MAG: O-antigen ligase domain-containing protein [Alsobacter sp.]